jgi:hypothetical protein
MTEVSLLLDTNIKLPYDPDPWPIRYTHFNFSFTIRPARMHQSSSSMREEGTVLKSRRVPTHIDLSSGRWDFNDANPHRQPIAEFEFTDGTVHYYLYKNNDGDRIIEGEGWRRKRGHV